MAFKFKVKKSPNPLQSAVAGFAGGFGQGFQKGANVQLQQMLKDREDKKNASVKEMNTFNNIISGLPQTPSNRSDILTARLSITNGSATAVEAVEVLSLGGIDFQTEKELGQSIKTQSTQLDPVVATQESSAMEQAGMQGSIPTPLEVEQRNSEAKVRLGIKNPLSPPQAEKTQTEILRNSQLKDIQQILIDNANALGISINEYINDNPLDNDVKLYQKLTGTTEQAHLPLTTHQDFKLRTDFIDFNESKNDSFRELSSMPNGTIIVNPNTGKRLQWSNDKWLPIQ